MVQIVLSPDWFLTKDLVICIFSVITLVLIAAFSLRFYCLNREHKGHLYFAISFILIAIAFLFQIITNFSIKYQTVVTKQFGFLTVMTYNTVTLSKILFLVGHFAHYFLLLIGLYILYVTIDKKSTMNHLLILYFLIITVLFSNVAYIVFHLTAVILLGAIAYNYYKIYKENKNRCTALLFASFSVIGLSQAIMMFTQYKTIMYAVGSTIQLVGFVILLIAFILVLKHGKKKQNRYHK